MSLLTQRLGARTPLGSLRDDGVRVVMALRLKVICDKRGLDPMTPLTERLGGIAPALRMVHITGLIANLWPEAFVLSPPCCRSLSHDEALLGALAEAAGDRDRVRFDTESRDMLGEEARDQLWRDLAALVPAPG